MKHPISISLLFFCATLVFSCSKSGNNYSAADHTAGIIKVRTWTGYSSGYLPGDTIQYPPPDTTHVPWAKAFSRTITDTSFSVEKVNGFAVSALGATFSYRSTDSTTKAEQYDTTMSGSAKSILRYYYAVDSITIEYHLVSGYNANQGQYYQVNEFLHTHH